jgi:Zn-dependent peptidase ImmA (M78 family)
MDRFALPADILGEIDRATRYPSDMPKDVQDLVTQVCNDYHVGIPKFNWLRRDVQYSQGTAYNHPTKYQITISEGNDPTHRMLVVLHELAHVIQPQGEHHGENFWKCAYTLYRKYGWKYGIDIRYAYEIEKRYRNMARTIGAEFLAGIW